MASKPVTALHDSGAVGPTPPASDETLVKAAACMSGAEDRIDLWDAFGLGPFINARRKSLGLPPLVGEVRDTSCPTCGVHKGQCRSEGDKPMRRWHIARVRLAKTGDQQ